MTSAVAANTAAKRSRASAARPAARCAIAEAPHAVLHDDHRAVDDEAEVERAEAHQVARETPLATMPVTVISIDERDDRAP